MRRAKRHAGVMTACHQASLSASKTPPFARLLLLHFATGWWRKRTIRDEMERVIVKSKELRA
jgi:hypothetical protein